MLEGNVEIYLFYQAYIYGVTHHGDVIPIVPLRSDIVDAKFALHYIIHLR